MFTPVTHFIFQPPMQVKGLDGLLRTSLDLELDLQVTRTRHNRLNEELHVLRELKKQLEEARQQGQCTLPAWVQEDERFRLLLKQTERLVRQTLKTIIMRRASLICFVKCEIRKSRALLRYP